MIVFRADLSPQTGLRHLRRCAWLASLLKSRNRVLVCCREDKKAAKFLAEGSVPFSLVRDPGAIDISEARAIVFDIDPFSGQDGVLLQKAKNSGVKTVQIVSAAAQPQAVDVVVSPIAQAENALLHHKFRHFNKAKRKYRQKIRNIFINLGDLLPYRDQRDIVETLHRLGYKMKIAPGLSMKKADKRNLMKIYPGVHFCGKSESPARAYFEADLALIPPGDEALEAACVGTPALYLPLGKMDEALVDPWVGKGTGVKIPALAEFSVQTVRNVIVPLDQETREKMGAAGKSLLDGLGVQRFLKFLKESGIVKGNK